MVASILHLFFLPITGNFLPVSHNWRQDRRPILRNRIYHLFPGGESPRAGGMMNRPNILFLMTDHTNAEAPAPGSPCLTPHLEALAAEGRRFERCYTPNAICSPARASLMTSLYPSTHGMWDCTHTQRKEWVDAPAARFRYFFELYTI